MQPRSRLDLPPRARVAFAAVYLALQLILIATATARPDRVFGFQMFNASADIRVALLRRVRAADGMLRLVRLRGGVWKARDARGELHQFRWSDYVQDSMLQGDELRVHARYGADAQLYHLQHALEYAARTIDGDAETRAFVAQVMVWDNGRPRAPIELEAVRP
jgi:hypothetical protein